MKRLARSCKNLIKRLSGKPAMLYGYKIPGGAYLPGTRVSNTTYIGCKKKLLLADHVFIGHYNFLDSCQGIRIGEGCQLTNYISVITHSSHHAIRLYGRSYLSEPDPELYERGPVDIGPYTFIGPHSLISPGTAIGKGSLVTAYSHVKGNFPDFSILSGNPARVVGSTRDLDARFLRDHPGLKEHYERWASDNPAR